VERGEEIARGLIVARGDTVFELAEQILDPAAICGSNASAPVRSWACPGVSRKRSGLPRASTKAWILVLNPPLLRPIA
jgi:hypothetical protein